MPVGSVDGGRSRWRIEREQGGCTGASGGGRAENEKKKSWRRWGGGAVGVPSYLVIYSPQAPGYPSRGITHGWAHRAPKMSLLRGAPSRGIYNVLPTFEFHARSILRIGSSATCQFRDVSIHLFLRLNNLNSRSNLISFRFPSNCGNIFSPNEKTSGISPRLSMAFPSMVHVHSLPRTIVRDK